MIIAFVITRIIIYVKSQRAKKTATLAVVYASNSSFPIKGI